MARYSLNESDILLTDSTDDVEGLEDLAYEDEDEDYEEDDEEDDEEDYEEEEDDDDDDLDDDLDDDYIDYENE